MTDSAKTPAVSAPAAPPSPPRGAPRVGPLATLNDVARELARLYRSARRGDTSPNAAAKLAYVLGVLKTTLEMADLERRLVDLEHRYETQHTRPH